ncbi:MAG: class I SAM-dependent methyltransferase [Amylibacter sp.]
MSRLESMMRRLTAQKLGLEWAVEMTIGLTGDALEIGLGNGRSYDHLREIAPDRRIWVIDRILQCHHSCVPPAENFLQGEAGDMLVRLAPESRRIVVAHYDCGIGIKEKDVAEAATLSPMIAAVMAPNGIIISGQPLVGITQVDGPDGITPDRYYFYKT